jgi:RNA polymerase sigma-70 factor (ECF subfamily)
MSDGDAVIGNWDAMMLAAQDGDAFTYRILLSEVAAWLIGRLRCRVPVDSIDQVVKETLIAIHRKRHTYDRSCSFEAWLTAVMNHKAFARRARRLKTEIADDQQC